MFDGLITRLSVARFTSTFKNSNISQRAAVSVISGTLQIVTSSLDRIAAGINATTLFLAPLILIVPVRGLPPFISSIFIVNHTLSTILYY